MSKEIITPTTTSLNQYLLNYLYKIKLYQVSDTEYKFSIYEDDTELLESTALKSNPSTVNTSVTFRNVVDKIQLELNNPELIQLIDTSVKLCKIPVLIANALGSVCSTESLYENYSHDDQIRDSDLDFLASVAHDSVPMLGSLAVAKLNTLILCHKGDSYNE